tara:strand:+ start:4326 stop:5198 length:873 start_codon:yes stop_codon:yes gene_type:complete
MLNIKKLKKLYKKNININQYLKKEKKINKTNIIKISYDIQTGSYIKAFNYRKSYKILKPMIKELKSINFKSLFDFGCGELTNFFTIVKNIDTKNKNFYANDLSFSRIQHGKKFLKNKISIKLTCFANNSTKLPMPDDSIDVVTTIHAIEPNKKDASKILKELWRISRKKLILLEPNNRLTDKMSENKRKIINKRFKKHNYVLNLEDKIKKITPNYKVIEIKDQFNAFNPASLFIVSKNSKKKNKLNFLNPNNNRDVLKNNSNFCFSENTGELFPIIDDIILFNKKEIFVE